jgi:hypothetical protein
MGTNKAIRHTRQDDICVAVLLHASGQRAVLSERLAVLIVESSCSAS